MVAFRATFAAVVFVAASSLTEAQVGDARFLDELDIRDTGQDRDFVLLAPFRDVDPAGTTWVVPTGTVVNGASIPRPLWTLIGGPWDGPYRRPSVVHDYFFEQKKYSSDEVHRVFYDAMVTANVGRLKAKLMYWAVVRFNRRWVRANIDPLECNRLQAGRPGRVNCLPAQAESNREPLVREDTVDVDFDKTELDAMEKQLKAAELPIEELKKRADAAYATAPKNVVQIRYIR